MAPHPKVCQAFRVTRALGIPDEEVKPVLKHLLKVFDRNWDFIEEDNYRTLIDSYYELNKNKRTDDGNGSSTVMHESEGPSKRPRLEEQKEKASPTIIKSELVDFTSSDVDDKIPAARKITDQKNSGMVKAKSVFSETRREDIPGNNKSIKLVEPKIVSAGNLPQSAVPTRVFSSSSPVSLVRFSPSDHSKKALASSSGNVDYKESSAKNNGSSSSNSDIIIASSPSGEVKLSLNCHSSLGQNNFQIPKLDAVLRYVENKHLRLYKHVGSQLSVSNLLKDICQSFLNFGTCSRNFSRIGSSTEVILGASNASEGSITRQPTISGLETKRTKRASNSDINGSASGPEVAEQKPTTFDKKRSGRYIVDIAKGAENVKISLVDEVGVEKLPYFNYIPHNIIYQNARVQVSLARISDDDCCLNCSGNCLSSELPCACTGETGGEFAYTPKGQMKEEFLETCISIKNNPQRQHCIYCEDCPIERTKNEYLPEKCKGHLLRKFVKECWRRCGCDMQCGNRVVQRGITCNLQVFVTKEGKGWGVRTLDNLPKGTFVCEYIGEIVTNAELYERNMQSSGTERHTYPVTLDADWGSERGLEDEDALCLDATYNGNVSRFINHRCCDANVIDIPVQIETPDRHYYHLAFFTTRAVRAYEELTWDYGIDFDDVDHPIKAFSCCCGSEFCRDKTQKGSKSKQTLLR